MLKAIIFDIDETLIDWQNVTEDWAAYDQRHLGNVFDYVEKNLHPLKDRHQFFVDAQDTFMDVWHRAKGTFTAPHLGELLLDLLVKQGAQREYLSADEIIRAYEVEPLAGVVPFPEVRQELANLRRMGLKLGLATNAIQPMSMRDEELRHLGLLEFFEDGSRFSAADVGFLKPHPRIFEMALQSLEAEPEEAVFVGDSLAADIVGAQQVGMKAVLRTRVQGSLFARNNGDLEIIPDGKITSLTEIYPLLDTWFPEWKDGDDA
jgi:HAD superfamily hydrolase (TIGR01509 family)